MKLALEQAGTPYYTAPEMIQREKYSYPADCWSFGVILHQLLSLERPFDGASTGDLVKATVTQGKKQGCYRGRVAIRATGSFNIQTREGVVQGISHRHCTLLQRGDGYGYQQQRKPDAGRDRASHEALCLPGMNAGVSRSIQG